MRFAAIQGELAKEVFLRYPHLTTIDSLILIDSSDEKVYIRSTGALRVAQYLGGIWKIFLMAKIIPRPLRDWVYDTFAKYRYTLFGKYDSCLLPPPEVRSRFID